MYSENDTRHFFQLLRSGLKPACAPAVTGEISAREWDDIFRMAADQGVCAVIGDGMERLPEELRPPRELRLRWALTAERQEKRYRHQQEKAAKMAAAFAENGIRLLLLKGLGLSRDYPVPAHRECGDIDIYLFGASDEGDRLLLQMGAQPYFDVPKHSSHTWDGILIENHRTILNVRRNRNERELNALLTALYVNYALLIATALCTYDLSFLYVMIYNLLTMLLIFLAVFRWKLWRLKHAVADEE